MLEMERNTIEVAEHADMLYLPVAASTKIFQGAMVAVNSSGYAVPATKAEGLKVVGRAETTVDNTTGIAGADFINVKRGVFIWENDTASGKITIADMLTDCYIKDDGTVSKTATASSVAGRVVGISEDGVSVETGL